MPGTRRLGLLVDIEGTYSFSECFSRVWGWYLSVWGWFNDRTTSYSLFFNSGLTSLTLFSNESSLLGVFCYALAKNPPFYSPKVGFWTDFGLPTDSRLVIYFNSFSLLACYIFLNYSRSFSLASSRFRFSSLTCCYFARAAYFCDSCSFLWSVAYWSDFSILEHQMDTWSAHSLIVVDSCSNPWISDCSFAIYCSNCKLSRWDCLFCLDNLVICFWTCFGLLYSGNWLAN